MVQDFDTRGHVKAVLLISFVLKLAKNPNAMPYNVLPIPFFYLLFYFIFGLPILRTLTQLSWLIQESGSTHFSNYDISHE